MGRLLGNVKVLSACGTKDVRLLILSECYYEEPYAGKPHVRICEGLKLQGFSLLDWTFLIEPFHEGEALFI